ncbi:MAG: hypothetical protein AMXMBFR85_11060 [Dehalococcoides mccartyi]
MILRTSHLDVGYGSKVVVSDINIEALRGQFICLLGPNGCGKSTLIKSLIKTLSPCGGSIYLKGCDIRAVKQDELAKSQAVVLTDRIDTGLLSVFDIVMLGRFPYTGFSGKSSPHDIEVVIDSLKAVSAEALADRLFGELSDGEKQKVMLARALAQEPELIILDEPTSHLDAHHKVEVMFILRRLTYEKGVTILASLHDIDMAMKSCDTAVLVKDGQIVSYGPPEDVLEDKRISSLYDMNKATYSRILGGIELNDSRKRGPVFVAAGCGKGANIYRSLSRDGFEIYTGVLHKNDIDYYVAKAIQAEIIEENPYSEISEFSLKIALTYLRQSRQVIDTGFPFGRDNLRNLELLREAIKNGKIIYSLREEAEARTYFGPLAERFIFCSGIHSLIVKLNQIDHIQAATSC